jgi:hypothetical protein
LQSSAFSGKLNLFRNERAFDKMPHQLCLARTFLHFNHFFAFGTSDTLFICAVGLGGKWTLPSGCDDSRDVDWYPSMYVNLSGGLQRSHHFSLIEGAR